MPFNVSEPSGSSWKKPATSSAVLPLTMIWPGSPAACRRAAMFGTCPHTSGRRSCPPAVTGATSTSPVWIPARACRSLIPKFGRELSAEPHDVLDDGDARSRRGRGLADSCASG